MSDESSPPAPDAALAAERERAARLEAELRELEDRHRLLVEGARDFAIILLSPAGEIASWNVGARRLVGYEAEEILGRPSAVLLTPEDRAGGLAEKELRVAAKTGRFEDESWAVRRDGSRFWASGVTTAQRGPAGGLRGYVKVFRDLTERRTAQEALREREQRLHAALSAAHMGTWLWDIQTNRDTLDASLRGLLGLADGHPVETLEDFLALVHPEDRPATAAAFARSASAGVSLNVEFRVVRPDGAVRWLRDRGDVLRDGAGRPHSLTGACVDITERVEMETALRSAHDELERRVQERTEELRRAQERALQAERLATIGQTMTALAHESGNALQRVQSFLERLRWRLEKEPEALRLVDSVQAAQNDLLRLYEDVRGYAAPIHLEIRPTDVLEVWRAAWGRVGPLHPGRAVRLAEAVGGCDPRCDADAFRLEQVFRNVLENALAAAPDPVAITFTCAAADLPTGPALRVAIRDNGPGLTAEQRRNIFEPFYTTKTRGTGLGMALAKRIIEAHGGQITAGDGPGAEIVVVLPRRKP